MTWSDHFDRPKVRMYWIVSCMGIGSSAVPSWDVNVSVALIKSREEAPGLFKSLWLKKHLGMVSENGNLLSYTLDKDGEGRRQGILYQIEKESLLAMFQIMDEAAVQPGLSSYCKKVLQTQKVEYLKGDRSIFVNRALFFLPVLSVVVEAMGENSNEHIGFMQAFLRSSRISEFRFQTLGNAAHSLPSAWRKWAFEKASLENVQWEMYQEGIVDQLPKTPEGIPQEVVDFENRLKRCQNDPKMLLELQEGETVAKAFQRLSRLIHTDKMPATLKENKDAENYYRSLFQALNMAYELVKE